MMAEVSSDVRHVFVRNFFFCGCAQVDFLVMLIPYSKTKIQRSGTKVCKIWMLETLFGKFNGKKFEDCPQICADLKHR
jgi:hypothetical protein